MTLVKTTEGNVVDIKELEVGKQIYLKENQELLREADYFIKLSIPKDGLEKLIPVSKQELSEYNYKKIIDHLDRMKPSFTGEFKIEVQIDMAM